jgi:signal transduction histidine kinase
VLAGLAFFVLMTLYGSAMMVLLKRHALRAEESARRAEESAQAKTRLLEMVFHGLRTPLNAAIGLAESLARGDSAKPQNGESIQGIIAGMTAQKDLINDILDLTKLETGAVRMRTGSCNVPELMKELPAVPGCRPVHDGVELVVRRTGGCEVPDVVLSRQGLRQVLVNLVGNAAKFTESGSITVEYGWEPEGPETGTLRLAVRDTGCGMPPEKLERMYDPFAQDVVSRMQGAGAKTRGTGLGLPIVKRLVDSACGTISVASVVGKGTEFAIVLPSLCVAHAPGERETPG